MGNFYSRLSYSFGNEDWKTEQKALQIEPENHILCVTASGDRPLNLLLADSAKIVSVDANPIQSALFDLKRAALRRFDYADYLAFLGIDPMKDRLKHYRQLESELSAASRTVWEKHLPKIEKGVIFQGSIEKMAKCSSALIRFCRGKKIKKLFSFNDLKEQAAFVEREFDSPMWKKAIHYALHPQLTRILLQDPGLYERVDPDIHVGNHIYTRLHGSLSRFLAKESSLISLIFKGDVDRAHFPPYLSEEEGRLIQKRLDRISHETVDLISYLENAPDCSFDRFSLSDVASYIPFKDFERMMRAVVRVAKPHARFCIRQFLTNYELPEELAPHFKRDRELEKELETEDRCFVYRFMVGEVVK